MEAALHPDVEQLAFLLGTWQGEGEGDFPSIAPFRFGEETRFWHVGDTYVLYSQSTWNLEDGSPFHAEMGFWRPQPDGHVDVSLAYPLGVSEIAEGHVVGTSVRVASRTIAIAGAGSEVNRLERSIDVDGDTLSYELLMETGDVPLTRHIWGRLKRAGD